MYKVRVQAQTRSKPPDVLTLRADVSILGVSETTRHRSDRTRKPSPYRHSVEGYRVCHYEDVEKLCQRGIERGKAA